MCKITQGETVSEGEHETTVEDSGKISDLNLVIQPKVPEKDIQKLLKG